MEYTEKERKILGWVRNLANSQGFYGRLYNELIANKEELEYLADQDFKDPLDMVMFLEV